MGNMYASVLEVMEQAAVKAFFHGRADELLDKNIQAYGIPDFGQSLVRYLIKSSIITVPVARSAKQQAEKLSLVKQSLQKT